MRLDYDLIREILLKVECFSDGVRGYEPPKFAEEQLPDRNKQAVLYHIKYLKNAHLIEPFFTNDWIIDLSPAGHEYLNNIRTETAWKQVKQKVQPLGSAALSVMADVARALVLSKLGL